jgi:outer membrane receptor for ferrienterochelin and colicin
MKRSPGLYLLVYILAFSLFAVAASGQEDKESLLFMGEGEVSTPSRRAQPIDESPAPVSVLTGEDIRRLGARSLPEALALLPGINVIRLSEAGDDVSIRGFNGYSSNKVLVMLDSRPLFNLADGSVDWHLIPVSLEDVDRIEVVRGPGSALYGENAFFGIINIITKAPQKRQTFSSLGGGGSPSYQAHAGFENTGYRASVEWIQLDRFATTKTDIDNPFLEQTGIQPLAAKTAIQRAFFRTDLDRRGQHLLVSGGGARAATDFFSFQKIDRSAFASLDDFFTAAGMDLCASLRAGYQDQERIGNPAFPPGPFRDFFRADGEVQGVYRPRLSDVVIFGLQVSQRTIHDDVFLGPDENTRSQTVGSIYGENQLALLDKTVYLTGGVRLDWYPGLGAVVSPRAGAIFLLPHAQAIKLGWGRAFRSPTFYELYGIDQSFSPVIFRGSDKLKPETIESYTLDYIYHDPDLLHLSVSLFYNDIRDLIVFQQRYLNLSGGLYELDNQDRGFSYGGEVELRFPLGRYLELWANYSYTYAVYVVADERIEAPFSPRHQANAGLNLDYRLLHASLWSSHVSGYIGLGGNTPFQDRVDMRGYSTVSGRIAFDITHNLSVSAFISDIGGQGHYESPVFAPIMPFYFIQATYRGGE